MEIISLHQRNDSFWSNTPSYYSLPYKGGGLYRRGGGLLRAESATRPRARPPVINLCKLPQKVGAEMAPTVLDLRQQIGDHLFKYFLPSLI